MFKGDFIHGNFVVSKNATDRWSIVSPSDLEDILGDIQSSTDHVDLAVNAAKTAFRPWASLSEDRRIEYLLRLREVFETRSAEIAETISRETGKPLWEAKTEAAALSGKIGITVNESKGLVEDQFIENALPGVEGRIRYKPRGVMAVVGPFNFPAHLPNGHIIPALLVGNTIVFKPSEKTPFVGQLLADCFKEADFPPGVFNLIQGRAEESRRLCGHDLVDGVLFTGSYEVGLKIKQNTLEQYWKLLALEMGGKNTTVIWDDADIKKSVYETVIGAFMTTGQRCSCTSRVVIHDSLFDQFMEKFIEISKSLKVGHWSNEVFMGPLIDKVSQEKYLKFQDIAVKEGSQSLLEGQALTTSHKGYYVTPSINLVDKLDTSSFYQQNEIFGPNVAVYRVKNYEEAVNIVNSGGYGLVMALFSKNTELYKSFHLDAKVGLLNWNRTTNGASSKLPFGGRGKSGNDRPSGHFAIQYCSIPVASLEDFEEFNEARILPGMGKIESL